MLFLLSFILDFKHVSIAKVFCKNLCSQNLFFIVADCRVENEGARKEASRETREA